MFCIFDLLRETRGLHLANFDEQNHRDTSIFLVKELKRTSLITCGIMLSYKLESGIIMNILANL